MGPNLSGDGRGLRTVLQSACTSNPVWKMDSTMLSGSEEDMKSSAENCAPEKPQSKTEELLDTTFDSDNIHSEVIDSKHVPESVSESSALSIAIDGESDGSSKYCGLSIRELGCRQDRERERERERERGRGRGRGRGEGGECVHRVCYVYLVNHLTWLHLYSLQQTTGENDCKLANR